MKAALVVAAVLVAADLTFAAVLVGLHVRRKVRAGAPVSTWDEQVTQAELITREPEPPARQVVLGVPGRSRTVCRACVDARTAGRHGEVCQKCRPLLIESGVI